MKKENQKKTENNQNLWINKIINFLGYFFIILGIYALIRISYNNIYLKDTYPLSPVISINPFVYYQTEEDCYQQFNYPFYDEKGKPREPSSSEKKFRDENIKNCLKRIKNQREENRVNDMWLTFFLFVLGGGIHLTKKFYLK